MQMIDIMKRLAQLDDKNPNVVKEDVDPTQVQALSQKLSSGEIDYDTFRNELEKLEYTDDSMRRGEMGLQGDDTPVGHRSWDREEQDWNDLDDRENDYGDNDDQYQEGKNLAECGPMGMLGGMTSSNVPANISITAGSGEELSNMLTSIMKLAGVEKVTPDHLGAEPAQATLTATPIMSVDSTVGDHDDMRAVLDKMNDAEDGEEETDEGRDEFGTSGVDNTPNRPDAHKAFSATAYSQNTNDGDGNLANGKRRTGMQPAATFESLMSEYRKFVAEGKAKNNFDIEDIKRLEQISDLETLKMQAFELISKPSAKPMKPEKVTWFRGALENMTSTTQVIKLMYDLLLSGDGLGVIGSRNSMAPNSYRATFKEENDDKPRLRLVKKIEGGSSGKIAKIYKDLDWNEYRVRFVNTEGKFRSAEDYHTDELQDAIDTAMYTINNNQHPYKNAKPMATVEEAFVAEDRGIMINGKEVDMDSLEIDGVDTRDYPDFVDAYISYALFTDGSELDDGELDQLTDKYSDVVHQMAYDSLHENDDNIAERMGEAIPIRVKFKDGTVKSERIVDGEPTSMMTRPELIQHFSQKYKKPVSEIIFSSGSTSHSAPAPTATKDTGFGYQDNDAFNRAHSRYDRQVPENELDEYFQFDVPAGKDRGPRDRGNDELARREKAIKPGGLGRGGEAGKEYKEKGRNGDAYKIAGPKGRLPENK